MIITNHTGLNGTCGFMPCKPADIHWLIPEIKWNTWAKEQEWKKKIQKKMIFKEFPTTFPTIGSTTTTIIFIMCMYMCIVYECDLHPVWAENLSLARTSYCWPQNQIILNFMTFMVIAVKALVDIIGSLLGLQWVIQSRTLNQTIRLVQVKLYIPWPGLDTIGLQLFLPLLTQRK